MIRKIAFGINAVFLNKKFKKANALRESNKEAFDKKYPFEKRIKLAQKEAKKLLKVYGATVKAEGYENIPTETGCVIMPNHQSNADPIALFSVMEKPFHFIAKSEIKDFFLVGPGGTFMDMYWLDRGDQAGTAKVFMKAVRSVRRENKALIIYPEGTRSGNKRMLPFKADSIEMAMMTKSPIVPTAFTDAWRVMNKTWKQKGKVEIKINFLEAIMPESYAGKTAEEVAKMVKERIYNFKNN